MCTAINLEGKGLFGRTLDADRSFGGKFTVLDKNEEVNFRHLPPISARVKIMGTAVKVGDTPLFFDGVNEAGLGVAGLNFPLFAVYHPPREGAVNLASYELITALLCSCFSVDEAENRLSSVNVTKDNFKENLPATPLHWIVADKSRSITVEPVAEGLKIHKNPVGVLANSPPFGHQMLRLSDYMQLSPVPPENHLCPQAKTYRYTGGMGAMGLPGDFSSTSRFIRAVYLKTHTQVEGTRDKMVGDFFHIMDCLSVPEGCVIDEEGGRMKTAYTCCIDLLDPAYYYTRYDDRNIVKKTF